MNSSLDFDTCWVDSDPVMFYGWARPDDGLDFPANDRGRTMDFSTTSVTENVVTIVDSIRNSTTVTTYVPLGWTPPPTNAAGTQTRVLTLANSTVTLSVAILLVHGIVLLSDGYSRTFPTVLVQWPTHYTYCPNVSSFGGSIYCNSPTRPVTASVTSPPPQPTKALNLRNYNYVDPERFSDPRGLLAVPVMCNGSYALQPACSKLLGPSYPPFQCHSLNNSGADWAMIDETWMSVATATSLLYADPAPEATPTPE